MKKKEIVICFIGIIITSIVIIILTSSNSNETFIQDGIMFALKIDGVKASSFPTSGKYHVDIDCDNGDGIYFYDEASSNFKFALKNMTSNVTCEVEFTSNPDTLKDIVEANATNETISANRLESSDYETNYIQTKDGSTSTAFVFNSSSSSWVFNSSNNAASYVLAFIPTVLNEYRVCVTPFTGTINIGVSSNNNSVGHSALNLSNPTEKTCSNFFQIPLGTSSNRYIVLMFQSTSSTTSFEYYVERKVTGTQIDLGYRYEGKNPNNYVWFNNEMWRIIGSVPTCTASGCSSSENLVKIIRKQPINATGYHTAAPAPTWNSSNAFNLLNSYYWGRLNATNESICVASSSSKPDCNYSLVGINPSGYFGSMVENIFWNTGDGDISQTPAQIYQSETGTQTVQARIGLLSSSDYAYATPNHTAVLSSYNTAQISSTNWLYGIGREQLINNCTSNTNQTQSVDHEGNLFCSEVARLSAYRPVVYLDSTVYVLSGEGTEANPYQIAM